MPSHNSGSAESNASSEQQSVSSGRRTPPFADRLIPYPVDSDFVSGTQSMVNTPPLHHTPPITWRQNKANITKDVTKEMESEQPDVVDQDLLLAATRKIEAAAREHPGWSSQC